MTFKDLGLFDAAPRILNFQILRGWAPIMMPEIISPAALGFEPRPVQGAGKLSVAPNVLSEHYRYEPPEQAP